MRNCNLTPILNIFIILRIFQEVNIQHASFVWCNKRKMCSFIGEIQKKVLLAQSLVVPSLKPMGCINIQPWENGSDSFLVWWWTGQGVRVQCCSTCPVLLTAINHQQLHQKLFSKALMLFQRSLLDYTHSALMKKLRSNLSLNFTVVLLHESCTWSHNSSASGSGPLAGSLVLATTNEERKEDKVEGATLYTSKAVCLRPGEHPLVKKGRSFRQQHNNHSTHTCWGTDVEFEFLSTNKV